MVTRIINGLEVEIDEYSANEMYFPRSFVETIETFDGDIEVLKENIYKWNGNTTYIPLSILWELTNYCNFKCPFCYINTEEAKRYPYIPLNECKKIIDELLEMGMLFCCLSGGECLLHSDFIEIYKYLKQKGVLVTIFTNGSLLNEEILELFRMYKPYKIEISIYGLSEEVFRNTTRSADIWNAEDVLKSIEQLKKEGINIRCKSPITTLNVGEIEKIEKWCKEREIDYYTSEEILPSNEGKSREEYSVKGDVLKTIKKNREAFLKRKQDNKFDYKKAWDCSAGKYAGVIGSDGNFYPCLSAVGIEQFTYSIKDGIGNAIKKHKELVVNEKGKQLFFCNGCEKCNICEKCILTAYLEQVHKMRLYCENLNK